jgi:hypothetical protein
MDPNVGRVMEHLPWLEPRPETGLMPPGQRALGVGQPGFRIRLGRDTRFGMAGGLFGQALTRQPFVHIGVILPAGTVLRFDLVSTGCEDPCSAILDPALIFVVEGGRWHGHGVAFMVEPFTDGLAVKEALAIEVLDEIPEVVIERSLRERLMARVRGSRT